MDAINATDQAWIVRHTHTDFHTVLWTQRRREKVAVALRQCHEKERKVAISLNLLLLISQSLQTVHGQKRSVLYPAQYLPSQALVGHFVPRVSLAVQNRRAAKLRPLVRMLQSHEGVETDPIRLAQDSAVMLHSQNPVCINVQHVVHRTHALLDQSLPRPFDGISFLWDDHRKATGRCLSIGCVLREKQPYLLLRAEDKEQSLTHHRTRRVHRVTNREPRLLTISQSSLDQPQNVPATQSKRSLSVPPLSLQRLRVSLRRRLQTSPWWTQTGSVTITPRSRTASAHIHVLLLMLTIFK